MALVADAAEHHQSGAVKRSLEQAPVGFVAERRRHQAIRVRDHAILRHDGMAFDDDAALAVRSQSEWALDIKRIPNPVSPDDVFSTGLMSEIDPKLVTWKPKR